MTVFYCPHLPICLWMIKLFCSFFIFLTNLLDSKSLNLQLAFFLYPCPLVTCMEWRKDHFCLEELLLLYIILFGRVSLSYHKSEYIYHCSLQLPSSVSYSVNVQTSFIINPLALIVLISLSMLRDITFLLILS